MIPIVISHYPTAEEVANALIRKENVREINVELKKSDYSLEKITEYLESEKREFLPSALLDATEKRHVDIHSEKGKTIWRTVFDYYQERNDLRREFHQMQDRLYTILVPRLSRKWLDFKAEVPAAFLKAFTLGIVRASGIIEKIRQRTYNQYFARSLYPDRHA